MRKSRAFWILLFILIVGVIGALATTYNVVVVRDYREFVKLGQKLDTHQIVLTLGSIGFAAALIGLILFFIKVLKEMKLNQLQSEFLASVSHSLKTPIATLELSSSMLKAESDPGATPLSLEEKRDLWAAHTAELARLKEHVETLLESARLQTSTPGIQKETLDLESFITKGMERWKRILGPHSSLKREGSLKGLSADFDPKLLGLAIDNLMDNARKFSHEAPQVTLRSRSSIDMRGWTIEVVDKGWGFEPEDSEKIFNRFFRSKPQAPYAIPGTGLGLFLVASACREQKIKVQAKSEGTGKGASFTLSGETSC